MILYFSIYVYILSNGSNLKWSSGSQKQNWIKLSLRSNYNIKAILHTNIVELEILH